MCVRASCVCVSSTVDSSDKTVEQNRSLMVVVYVFLVCCERKAHKNMVFYQKLLSN